MVGIQVMEAYLATSLKRRRRRRSVGGGVVDCSLYDSSLITVQTEGLSDVSLLCFLNT